MIERIARAKINLALHVTGRREDGYHLLDTLAGFADFGDLLRFEPAPDGQISLKITGPFAAEPGLSGEDNIVAGAARLLAQAADIPAGAAITLEKNLPVASGIGGGSADAAAALLGLRELWQVADDIALEPLAMRLGADVPMCLVSAPLRARGIGEVVEPLAGACALHAVLVNPRVAVATPQVFAALDARSNPPIGDAPENPFDPDFLAGMRNDLEAPARKLFPVIGDVLASIGRQEGCLLARMSGSGATCFGLFATKGEANAAHRAIVDKAPHWWSVPAEIGGTA